ncbi:hypothetical protein V1511DRAFT_499297 [Dipodascopsis uninucleata]
MYCKMRIVDMSCISTDQYLNVTCFACNNRNIQLPTCKVGDCIYFTSVAISIQGHMQALVNLRESRYFVCPRENPTVCKTLKNTFDIKWSKLLAEYSIRLFNWRKTCKLITSVAPEAQKSEYTLSSVPRQKQTITNNEPGLDSGLHGQRSYTSNYVTTSAAISRSTLIKNLTINHKKCTIIAMVVKIWITTKNVYILQVSDYTENVNLPNRGQPSLPRNPGEHYVLDIALWDGNRLYAERNIEEGDCVILENVSMKSDLRNCLEAVLHGDVSQINRSFIEKLPPDHELSIQLLKNQTSYFQSNDMYNFELVAQAASEAKKITQTNATNSEHSDLVSRDADIGDERSILVAAVKSVPLNWNKPSLHVQCSVTNLEISSINDLLLNSLTGVDYKITGFISDIYPNDFSKFIHRSNNKFVIRFVFKVKDRSGGQIRVAFTGHKALAFLGIEYQQLSAKAIQQKVKMIKAREGEDPIIIELVVNRKELLKKENSENCRSRNANDNSTLIDGQQQATLTSHWYYSRGCKIV